MEQHTVTFPTIHFVFQEDCWKMSIGVPIKVLHEAEGHIVTCETNTGEVYRGKLIEAEDNMNCQVGPRYYLFIHPRHTNMIFCLVLTPFELFFCSFNCAKYSMSVIFKENHRCPLPV